MKTILAMFLVVSVLCAPAFAQNVPITPEWEVSRSIDKMTDKASCVLRSPIGEWEKDLSAERKKLAPLAVLALINNKLHVISSSKYYENAYKNILIRVDNNKPIEFTKVSIGLSVELDDNGKVGMLISQLKTSKVMMMRIAVSVDNIYDLKISASLFNEGYSKYKQCPNSK